jgi:hypothetical protein
MYIKKATPMVKASLEKFASDYRDGKSILEIAKAVNYPPFLMARLLLEQMTTLPAKMLGTVVKDPMSQLQDAKSILKDTFVSSEDDQISPSRLGFEIHAAVTNDPLCGPRHNVLRRMSGVEFEVVLERQLAAIGTFRSCKDSIYSLSFFLIMAFSLITGIPFETEANLRARGTAKTPDALLRAPVAIHHSGEWKIINWIDSKALFGDATTHRQSVVPQAESYLHRFGPGLVIYWFGHAPLELLHSSKKDEIVVVGWELPRQFMLPTGEIRRRQ